MFELSIAKAYLKKQGADKIPHIKGGTLFDHLGRVEAQLEKWGLPMEIRLAGLFHSIYSTSHFPHALISEETREELSTIIGEPAERLAWIFGRLNRLSLTADQESNLFSYIDRLSEDKVALSQGDCSAVLHILIANELDHATPHSFDYVNSRVQYYQPLFWTLSSIAKNEVLRLNPGGHDATAPHITFIGHAGVWFKSKNTSLVVDPWLYSSNLERPGFSGLGIGQRTIDYLIPRPVHTASELAPDIILLSHFHTHHSPLAEIREFALLKPVDIVCPDSNSNSERALREKLGPEASGNITFHFCNKDSSLEIRDMRIEAYTHTHKEHLAYRISIDNLSMMHITDAQAHMVDGKTVLDPLWDKLRSSAPSFLFIGASNHLHRVMHEGVREIHEHTTLSPVQAARLIRLIEPKNVGLIGMYNYSIWDSVTEYTHSAQDVENEFFWVLSYLEPSVRVHLLKPGNTFTSKNL